MQKAGAGPPRRTTPSFPLECSPGRMRHQYDYREKMVSHPAPSCHCIRTLIPSPLSSQGLREGHRPHSLHPVGSLGLNAAAAAKSHQSCPTLCDPIDGNPPGSPVPGILQARTVEWVAISVSNAWKWKVKVKSLSRARLLATQWTAAYQAPPSMGFSRQEYWSGLPLPSPRIEWKLAFQTYGNWDEGCSWIPPTSNAFREWSTVAWPKESTDLWPQQRMETSNAQTRGWFCKNSRPRQR